MNKRSYWSVFILVISVLVLAGCGDRAARDLGLLDSAATTSPEELDAERRRLDSLQLVRWVDAAGDEFFMPVSGLVDLDDDYCDFYSLCPGVTSGENCLHQACTNRVRLCTARFLQSAALVRAEPLVLPRAYKLKANPPSPSDLQNLANYDLVNAEAKVPPQSVSTRAALLRFALGIGREVVSALTNYASCPHSTDPNDAYQVSLSGAKTLPWQPSVRASGLWAETTVEAVNFYRELSEDTVDVILAAADAQRSTSSTTAQGAARSVAGAQLSRAEAAHILVGGAPGLLGDTTKAFCSSPELGASAKSALQVLRRAAPDPADIMSESVDIGTLLNAATAAFAHGSVRVRLEALSGSTISSVEDEVGLSREDFVQARSYMAQEIRTFARDGSVTFVPKATGTIPGGVLFYAATGREPSAPPAEYWAAVARSGQWIATGTERELQATDVASTLSQAFGRTRQALGLVDGNAYILGTVDGMGETHRQFQGPLNLLVSQDGEVGQLALVNTGGGGRLVVSGYKTADKIRVVKGLSGLLCATTGKIEGEPCAQVKLTAATLTTLATTVTQPYFYVGLGHQNAVYNDFIVTLPANELLFVVKPRNTSNEVPGGYDVLGGISLKGLPIVAGTYRFPLIPELDRKVGEILRPSEKWCTRPAVECDGTLFDERLPLENELSDDGDGVESSWRHYLGLAEQAAQEAHLLGEQYLQSGLEVDRQLEADQIREVQDRQRYLSRIEGEMETVQDICGIAMDTSEFIGLFGGEAVGPSNGLSCTAAVDCCGGVVGPTAACPYSCTNNLCIPTACAAGTGSDCPAPYQCINQRCVYSPNLHLQQEQGSSEGISRLQECIGNDTVLDYVALGTEPLCLWDGGTADPTSLCAGANEQYPCPRAARRLINNTYDCNVPAPAGKTPELVEARLGLADASALVSGQDACQLLRAYRNHRVVCPGGTVCPGTTPPQTVLDYLSKALTPALLSPQHLARAGRLGWRVEFPTDNGGNVSSVLVDGKVKWTTAPNWPGWPCSGYRPYNPSDPAIACPDPSALFCTTLASNCAQDTDARRNEAARLNLRLFIAVAVLKGLTLGDFDKLEIPVELPAEALAALGQPVTTRDAGRHFEQQLPGGLWRLYDDASDASAPAAFWRFLEFNQNMSETATAFEVPASNGPVLLRQPLPAASSKLLTHTDALLASVIHVENAFSLSSWAEYFNAERPLPISDPDVLSGSMDNPYLTPRLEYTEGSLEDAAELLCEVTRDDTWSYYPTDCPQKSVAELTSSQDFSGLKEYGVCRLQAFSRAVGSLVLPRIPVRAVEGVRSFSVAGGFPAVGGEMGEQILRLRGALTRYSEFTQTMAESAQQLNDIADRMNFSLQQIGLQSSTDQAAYEIALDNGVIASLRGTQASIRMTQIAFQKQAATWKATLDCFQAMTSGLAGGIGGGLAGIAGALTGGSASCFASFMSAGIERQNLDYESQIAGVESEIAKVQAQIAGQAALIEQNRALLNQIEHAREMLDLRAQLRGVFTTMASVTTEAQAALDDVRASLTEIEGLRLKVQRSIGRALQFETTQAAVTENIDAVLNARLNVSKKRYLQAHKNAVKLAFLAKRAIEQRLGMHLSELRADMPLVEAPATWESDVCAAEGIDYEAIRAKAAESGTEAVVPVDYASAYIGDYVTKLKNVVESYRLQFDFHEGTDEAIVSLRDDLLNVRAPCSEFAGNLLKYSAELDHLVGQDGGAGWQIFGCATTSTEGTAPTCLQVGRHSDDVVPDTSGSTLLWGATSASDTRLAQKVALKPGRYRLSWYSPMRAGDVGPEVEVALYGDEGEPLDPVSYEDYVTDLTDIWSRPSSPGHWPRHYRFFDVRSELDELYVTLFRAESGTGTTLGVGGVMLERVSDGDATNPQFLSPPPFVATTDSLETLVPDCEDTNGQIFKQSAWEYRCAKLCTDGFSDNCLDSAIGDRCYWETNFSIDQRALEAGRIFTQSGFARGNFNYRIEDVAVNFVGSDVRDCENSNLPITCFSAGFVPYTLKHIGPFFVRNHSGDDFQVKLFNGNIEHARGLGIERYLTNPLSSTDRELMSAYVRSEFQGRPLDGNFALRVWDEGITIDAIQDVQLYIKYRYWTRFD